VIVILRVYEACTCVVCPALLQRAGCSRVLPWYCVAVATSAQAFALMPQIYAYRFACPVHESMRGQTRCAYS